LSKKQSQLSMFWIFTIMNWKLQIKTDKNFMKFPIFIFPQNSVIFKRQAQIRNFSNFQPSIGWTGTNLWKNVYYFAKCRNNWEPDIPNGNFPQRNDIFHTIHIYSKYSISQQSRIIFRNWGITFSCSYSHGIWDYLKIAHDNSWRNYIYNYIYINYI